MPARTLFEKPAHVLEISKNEQSPVRISLPFHIFLLKKFGRINEVVAVYAYYRGRLKSHDSRAVMTNTPYIAFTVLFSSINNRNADIVYSN